MPAKLVTYNSQNYAGTLGSGLHTGRHIHPHTHTYACMHKDVRTEAVLRKQVCTSHRPACVWFNKHSSTTNVCTYISRYLQYFLLLSISFSAGKLYPDKLTVSYNYFARSTKPSLHIYYIFPYNTTQ